MKNPKVSIIVGCYNVARFLKEGRLNDVYNQTYKNWELILVDDGSTDETRKLLDAEAETDPRIRVIHKENGGLGSARNAGLDIAEGEYVWSIDLDDHVEHDCVEYCVAECESRNCDVLMFGFYAITPSLGTKQTVQLQETIIEDKGQLRDAYLDRILFIPNGNGFFWNKFYRRSFIEKYHLRFENQKIQQDEVFNLMVYEHLEKCYISSRVFYYYYIYNTGNNRSRFIANRYEIYKSVYHHFCHLKDIWGITDKRYDAYLYNRLFSNLHDLLRNNLIHPKSTWSKKERKTEMNRVMSDEDYKKAIIFKVDDGISIEDKMFLFAYRKLSVKLIVLLNMFFTSLRKAKRIVCC